MINIKNQYRGKSFYISTLDVGGGLKLWLVSTAEGLILIEFNMEEYQLIQKITKMFGGVKIVKDPHRNRVYEKEIADYFLGKTTNFTVPLDLVGTEFQKQVWRALMEVPYGETASYKDIAIKIENPKAMRAVGMANNKNKIPIIIPCHRIIGANDSLVGYGGGLPVKVRLLQLEGIKVKGDQVIREK